MSRVWPSPEDTQASAEWMIAPERNDYRHFGNLTLGVLGIGVEALGGIDVLEGSSRDLAAMAFGLFLTGIGYLSDNGGVAGNLQNFKVWTANKFLGPAEPDETGVEQIDSQPVIV